MQQNKLLLVQVAQLQGPLVLPEAVDLRVLRRVGLELQAQQVLLRVVRVDLQQVRMDLPLLRAGLHPLPLVAEALEAPGQEQVQAQRLALLRENLKSFSLNFAAEVKT